MRCVTRGEGGGGVLRSCEYKKKKKPTRVFSFNICLSIFYDIYIYTRKRGETRPLACARLLGCNSAKTRTFFSPCYAAHARNHFTSFNVPRANLCAHPLWRLRAYCGTEIRIRIQEISGSFRCSPDR